MSPVVKRKGERFTLPSKYLLFILTILCTIMMLVTFGTNVFNRPFNRVVGYVIVPFEQGIAKAGEWLANRSDELVQIRTLLAENSALKEQVASLTEENTLLQQDKYELNELRGLLELDEEYGDYNKIGARIISRDSGNWYSSFVIDKGSNDGLADDMNVIAGGGLVGRITSVGPNWSRVTSIISDNSNVSGMTLATGDNLIVSGDLQMMAQGVIPFSKLVDSQDAVAEGDKVVTSDISDKYLPNILIGYISTINKDTNNLTKSGYLTPVVDFEHLSEVLVITDKKQQVREEAQMENNSSFLRKIVVVLLILLFFVLQCSVFNSPAMGGIIPNLMIILTSSFGFMRGEKEGLLIGFSCGLLCDIFFGSFLGFYAMVMMYIGFVNGKFSRIFYPEDIKLPLALIIVSDISYGLICYILMFLLRGRFHFPYYFTSVILPEALYTIVVTIILYPLILKINQKLEEKEKRSAQKFVS